MNKLNNVLRNKIKRFVWSKNIYYWFPAKKSNKFKYKKGVEIVIEGFPRSANTFGVRAFMEANPNVHIAHHMHVPIQILSAARNNVPVLLLIRNPSSAISSLILRNESNLPIRSLLVNYISFHKAIMKVVNSIVICDFNIITIDFNLCIDAINKKYKTRFNNFEHNEVNVNKIMQDMIDEDKRLYSKKVQYTVPNKEKDAEKEKILALIENKDHEILLNEANQMYIFFLTKGIYK